MAAKWRSAKERMRRQYVPSTIHNTQLTTIIPTYVRCRVGEKREKETGNEKGKDWTGKGKRATLAMAMVLYVQEKLITQTKNNR